VNAHAKHKPIRHYAVSDAAVHDSQELDGLLDKGNTCNDVFADSAYRSTEIEAQLRASGYRAGFTIAGPSDIPGDRRACAPPPGPKRRRPLHTPRCHSGLNLEHVHDITISHTIHEIGADAFKTSDQGQGTDGEMSALSMRRPWCLIDGFD
jgi:hypothetical protein